MFYVLSLVAVGCCGLFAGAAVYINLVEHPVRLRCGMDEALREWASSYGRASVMQASLALLGGVAGVLTSANTRLTEPRKPRRAPPWQTHLQKPSA